MPIWETVETLEAINAALAAGHLAAAQQFTRKALAQATAQLSAYENAMEEREEYAALEREALAMRSPACGFQVPY